MELLLRNSVAGVGILVFLSIGALFLLNIREKNKQDKLLQQKKEYLQQQITLAQLRTQAVTVAGRIQVAQTVIGKQPRFLKYITDFNSFLPASSEARLLGLAVDANSDGTAQLEFASESTLQKFLDGLEEDTTKNAFRKVLVQDLSTNFENQKALTLVTLAIEFYGKQTTRVGIK